MSCHAPVTAFLTVFEGGQLFDEISPCVCAYGPLLKRRRMARTHRQHTTHEGNRWNRGCPRPRMTTARLAVMIEVPWLSKRFRFFPSNHG